MRAFSLAGRSLHRLTELCRFVANWAVNASLDYTSVASTTILSSMSGAWPSKRSRVRGTETGIGFFTLGIGRIFQVEILTYAKLGAVFTR